MLFRTSSGQLIELKQNAYVNDTVYYEKLMEVHRPLPKLDNATTHKHNHQSNKQREHVSTDNVDSQLRRHFG